MRTCLRNKRKLYYSLYIRSRHKYEYYVDDDGNEYSIDTGDTADSYTKPVAFRGNISMSGSGQSDAVEFGLNLSDYNASLVTDKGLLPIDETSLIWCDSEPKTDDEGYPIKDSADYCVVKVSKSLNEDKYILKKLVKENA